MKKSVIKNLLLVGGVIGGIGLLFSAQKYARMFLKLVRDESDDTQKDEEDGSSGTASSEIDDMLKDGTAFRVKLSNVEEGDSDSE